jgi:hypothetical protein
MPESGGRVVQCNGQLLFDPDDSTEDDMVSRVIASLDPEH